MFSLVTRRGAGCDDDKWCMDSSSSSSSSTLHSFIRSFVHSPISIITRRILTIVPLTEIWDLCLFYTQPAKRDVRYSVYKVTSCIGILARFCLALPSCEFSRYLQMRVHVAGPQTKTCHYWSFYVCIYPVPVSQTDCAHVQTWKHVVGSQPFKYNYTKMRQW